MAFPLDSTVITALAAAVSALLGVIGSLWNFNNFLRDKFIDVEHHLEKLLDIHEEKDQARHEDNIQRFSVIETQLTTLIKNGHK